MALLDRVRRPEYTGENRCMACTYVNALLAIMGTAGVVAIGAQLVAPVPALAAGAGFAVLAAASIWLRGYLVPKTPTLTKRYMPEPMLRQFGKRPAGGPTAMADASADGDGAADGAGEFDHEQLLLEAGAVEPCEDVDDLCLTDVFAASWNDHLADVPQTVEPEAAADAIGIDLDHENVHVQYHEQGTVVTESERPVVEWPSDEAMVLDVAGARALAEHSPDWPTLTSNQRAALVAGLRVFAEECPDGQPAELSEEVVESCCTSHTVVTLECVDSGARLFEWRVS